MTTYGDWFTGFGGMTIGAIEAGLEVVFGAEIDPKIATVYRQNIGDHILVCDLLKTPVTAFPHVDVFHASPPCPNFSNAKANGEETENDIALSAKVAEYITYHLPDVFTLENVYQYRNSKSWQVIAQALHTHGYLFNYWHVNMADYGVPQTRQRMIVIAQRDGAMPQLPPATHTAEPQPGLFGTTKRWVSWYEAIEDLIPDLPDSEFATWQIERLPSELSRVFISDSLNYSSTRPNRFEDEPSQTVVVHSSKHPAPKAFIISDQTNEGDKLTLRFKALATTVRAGLTGGASPRAFIVDGQANEDGSRLTLRSEDEPAFTQTATATKRPGRAFAAGRVVQMTPRALARFQSFPDWYDIGDKNRLACQGIGNAVPPLFAEKLYRHLVPEGVTQNDQHP